MCPLSSPWQLQQGQRQASAMSQGLHNGGGSLGSGPRPGMKCVWPVLLAQLRVWVVRTRARAHSRCYCIGRSLTLGEDRVELAAAVVA